MDSHGLNILVDPIEARRNKKPLLGDDMLARWICEKVDYWEQYRNTNYLDKWDEYYRIWRTEWNAEDKERMVERSKIMPATLSELVSQQVSTIRDAFFKREVWIDAQDDDPNSQDVREMASRLRFDAEKWKVKQAVRNAIHFGAVYGTCILKVGVAQKEYAKPTQIVDEFGRVVLGGATTGLEPCLTVTAISPREFVVQPGALSIADSIGVAHITQVPVHHVLEGQRKGYYRAGEVGTAPANWQREPYDVEQSNNDKRDTVKLVEWHGLVPKALLPGSKTSAANKSAITNNVPSADIEMVEAICLVVNDDFCLKAVQNPYIPVRRSVFACQYGQVPDAFWGRGVVEAGYHPYKALQTEIRARADGLALANYPTVWRDEASLAGDQTRDDPDEKIIAPGKEYLVSGDPNRVIREFKFSGPDRGSSQAIADYQSMLITSANALGQQAAQSIELDIMQPLVEAMAWRCMQFMPERYPPIDFSFSTKGAIGIMQEMLERNDMIEVLKALPEESPSFAAVLRLIIETGPYSNRSELLQIVNAEIADRLTPKAPPPDPAGEARLISAQHRIKEHADEMALEMERLKRQDVELLIKAKQGSKDSANDATPKQAEEVNINITQGGKRRVKIRRTDEGLVGETEDF